MPAKHKQTIPQMKQFILKVSEWHALLFLTSLPLPPPLYFFLGQNYSENVFEFVNHFDSPSPLTFAGKAPLCQKTVPPAPTSSYDLLSCQGLMDGAGGPSALGIQHRWCKGRVGREGKPQHLSRQWWALWHRPARSSLKKPPLRMNREAGCSRRHHAEGVPHWVVASGY